MVAHPSTNRTRRHAICTPFPIVTHESFHRRTVGITEHEQLTQRKSKTADRALRAHPFGTPVIGVELLGCRPHWTSPLCEIGISGRSVYQMTTSREQALGSVGRVPGERASLPDFCLVSQSTGDIVVESHEGFHATIDFSNAQSLRVGQSAQIHKP